MPCMRVSGPARRSQSRCVAPELVLHPSKPELRRQGRSWLIVACIVARIAVVTPPFVVLKEQLL